MTEQALPTGTQISGYTIQRVIGQGGFGIVYEAVNSVTEQRVAIKEFFPRQIVSRKDNTFFIHEGQERDLLQALLLRFSETAKLQYGFSHPNILKVLNFVSSGDTGYMVTDYVDGVPLEAYLRGLGGHFQSEAAFRAMMEPVVGAVGYVHRKGHLHRDISPDNIMVTRAGQPVLIDFGSIKRSISVTNTDGSTLVFMREAYSPREQRNRTSPEGFYTDIFALAGTMYMTLVGEPPVSVAVRADAIVEGKPDPYIPLAQAAKMACAPAVCAAIDRALKLQAVERPQTIEAFAQELGWSPSFGDTSKSSADTELEVQPDISIPRDKLKDVAGLGSPAQFDKTQTERKLFEPTGGGQGGAGAPGGGGPGKPPRRWGWLVVPAAAAAILLVLGLTSDASGLNWSRVTAWLRGWVQPPSACEQQEALDAALRGGLGALKAYATECAKAPNGAQAQAEVARREADAFGKARACIVSACAFEPCLNVYEADFRDRLDDLRALARQEGASDRCKPKPTFCEQSASFGQAVASGPAAVRYYLGQCPSGPFSVEARAKLTDWEQREYANARQCIDADAACTFDDCVGRYGSHFTERLVDLQAAAQREAASERCRKPCDRDEDYQQAVRGGISGLRAYLNLCPSGSFSSRAAGELQRLERQRDEQVAYNNAVACIQSTCDARPCAEAYRQRFGDRYADLLQQASNAAAAPRCRPAQALPDGTYQVVRGYRRAQADGDCRTEYPPSEAVVSGGSFAFRSFDIRKDGRRVGRTWRGTIDQSTGIIDIQKQNIIDDEGKTPNTDTFVHGHFASARMFNQKCSEGTLRVISGGTRR